MVTDFFSVIKRSCRLCLIINNDYIVHVFHFRRLLLTISANRLPFLFISEATAWIWGWFWGCGESGSVNRRSTSICWAWSFSLVSRVCSSSRADIADLAWWYSWKADDAEERSWSFMFIFRSSSWQSLSKRLNRRWNIPRVICSPGGHTYYVGIIDN